MDNCNGEPSTSLMGYGRKIFERDGYKCVYCDRKFRDDFWSWMLLTVEHVIPRNRINEENREFIKSEKNLKTACRVCNNISNKIDLEKFDNPDLEKRVNEILNYKKENIKERLGDFRKFYNECIKP